jgi:hypothetical protein
MNEDYGDIQHMSCVNGHELCSKCAEIEETPELIAQIKEAYDEDEKWEECYNEFGFESQLFFKEC